MKRKYIIAFNLILLGMIPSLLIAQATEPVSGNDMAEKLIWVLIFAIFAVSLVSIILSLTILSLVRKPAPTESSVPDAQPVTEEQKLILKEKAKKTPMTWAWMMHKLTDAVPVAREADVMLDHDYDGIKELDNNLPPWWKYGFYISIVYAVFYLVHFHVTPLGFMNIFLGPGVSSTQEYLTAMEVAEEKKAAFLATKADLVNENSVTLALDAADLSEGKRIYTELCVACHGAEGQGGVGPNFADSYWIHGGDVKDLFKTIKYGVPEKGMIAWEAQLRPKEMQQVASFILSLQGTNPPNPKEPQGELYVPKTVPADSTKVDSAKTVASI